VIDMRTPLLHTINTGHEEFDKEGYLVVRNIWNPKDFYGDMPRDPGTYTYGRTELVKVTEEQQVPGSIARYSFPPYRHYHSQIRLKLEKIIGRKLYNTYYYDRFYSPGMELAKHKDRDACEISFTFHVATNAKEQWPIWIETPYGEDHSCILNPGDGMLYKGCDCNHWREELPREYTKTWYGKKVEKEGILYHQIFFHYVLADGLRCQFANELR